MDEEMGFPVEDCGEAFDAPEEMDEAGFEEAPQGGGDFEADDGDIGGMVVDVDGELVSLAELAGTGVQDAPGGELEPYLALLDRYPELQEAGRLPDEAAEAVRRGENPVVAYQDFLLRQQQAETLAMRQREAVRARCPGSAAGCGDGEIDGAFAAFDEALYGNY